MDKLTILFKTSRPALWFAPVLMFLIGMHLSAAEMTNFAMMQLMMMAFPLNMLIYGFNDVYDYESDKRNPRKGDIQGIKLNPKYHKMVMQASYISAALIVLSSLATMDVLNIAGMSILLFFSYAYSVPPLRFKTNPPLDSFSNGFIYCLGPALMGFSFGGTLFEVTHKLYYIAFAIMGSHAITTVFDYEYDKRAGDTTFAIKFGRRTAALFGLFTYVIGFLFAGIQTPYLMSLFVIGALVAAYIAVKPKRKVSFVLVKLLLVLYIIAALLYISGT